MRIDKFIWINFIKITKFIYFKIKDFGSKLKGKFDLFKSFINFTKKSDYLSWKVNDDKSLKEWFIESTINIVSALLILVAIGAVATWSLSQYLIVPFELRYVLANTAFIWLSLRLVKLLKDKNSE